MKANSLSTSARSERRSEQRVVTNSPATLLLYDELGPPNEVRCELVDQSNRGCKLRHNYGELQTGLLVGVKFGTTETRAMVVWTRKFQGYYETGFSFQR